MFDHISDAMKQLSLIRLDKNLYGVRFETMKIYSTLAAVEHLLNANIVKKGDTLLDSSSGIYAYALALACHKFGMKCYIVASQTVDKTLMTQLRILGATVEQVQPSATFKLDQSLRIKKLKEIMLSDPSIHWMQQYHDNIHYLGYKPVGDQIADALGTEQLTVVGSVGSGCSTGGIIQCLRAKDENVELVGVQPFGSITFKSDHIEDPHIIGIGSTIPFRNVQHALYDKIHWVSYKFGISGSVDLLRRHAIFAGHSSGCNYLVAAYEAKCRPERNFIFIMADTGHRYVDDVFVKYQEAQAITNLQPKILSSLEALSLPWSTMDWNRLHFVVHE